MRALKYFLVSLLVVSIVKKTRAQGNEPITTVELTSTTPAVKLRVKKGIKTIGYYWPDQTMIILNNGDTFVDIRKEKKGNYKRTGLDSDIILVTTPNGTKILEKIGIAQHQRLLPERPRKVTHYGTRIIKPKIHRT